MQQPEAQNLYNRYSRQILFQPIGRDGQERLAKSRVAIVGIGALGTVAANQLVRAGVGFLRIIDRDIVEFSNLQRQYLFDEADAADGRPKATAAADKLRMANSAVEVEPHVTDLTWRNAEDLLSDVDVIVDATDNFEVRYLINDVAVKHNIPWSYGGAVSSYGMTAFFRSGETPCLVCLFGEDTGGGHETCETVGVIAPVVSIIASLQVGEVLKYLTGNHESLSNALVQIDVWRNQFQSTRLGSPSPTCRCCAKREFLSLQVRKEQLTVSMCGRNTVQVRPQVEGKVALDAIARRLSQVATVRQIPDLLRCDFGDWQLTLFADGRALIHGVSDPTQARSLYAKYIGI
jgi:molybdopterin/thiamine biosynthesis adenylyltransferase